MFFDCFTITRKLGMWGKSYFRRKRLKFRMRVKFRNKSSEWKDRKILNRWELIQAHIWLQGGHEGHDGTKMFQVENGNLTQALFHLTRNIHILTQMDVFFFFPFLSAGKINYIFFLKMMSACSAGNDGGICTSPRWMFSSPCVWPWIQPEFPLSVFQRHWKFPSTK